MPAYPPRRAGLLLKTGQTTTYHVGDDGDRELGLTKRYEVLSTSAQSGTTNVDSPHYAAATIAFAATTPGTITDTANLLASVKTGDVIVIRNSASNDGVYNVSTGNVAGTIRTTEATLPEAAGAYVSICKRVAPSNNTVIDLNTGLMWLRYTTGGPALKIGPASTGALVWYDATKCYTLHPAAADLQMIASSNTLRIVGGAGEVGRYHAGDAIVCSGFANAVNNLPGYPVVSVTVNGADLDIVLQTFNNTLVDEAAAGARSITLVCQSIFAYCAAANAATLGGFSDWRIPNDWMTRGLMNWEGATAAPDATVFPSWPTGGVGSYIWSSTTNPLNTAQAMLTPSNVGSSPIDVKTAASNYCAVLVRGGV
ncbi:MAG: DUF1566 domain-containing protein [Sulfuricaulis sp.]|nr:DUF1566 domain-containing protein [Sulfuricaulis sp.]